ncbi:MAG: hypothetical protein CMJ78_08655 [Planctomycetaceae bacterium]|nr:hypothetical protein [Planctomycetaceae bacterium]
MDCPIADELRSIVMKTMGAAAQIRQGSEFLSRQIRWAFIFGSLASQSEQSYSDVDLLVVGDVTFSDVVSSIRNVEQSIQRPINPNVYSESEFCNKLCEGHHFLTRVVSGEKLMLIGDEHDMSSLLAG